MDLMERLIWMEEPFLEIAKKIKVYYDNKIYHDKYY